MGLTRPTGFAIRAMCGGRGRWLTCWGRNIMWWRKDATEELPCMQIPWSHGKNGKFYLKPCLNTHKPIDLVILMLGSNDLKKIFHADAAQAADGAGTLVYEILKFTEQKQGYQPQILLVSPPEIGPAVARSHFRGQFDASAVEQSKAFAAEYARVAAEKGVRFFDAAKYCQSI